MSIEAILREKTEQLLSGSWVHVFDPGALKDDRLIQPGVYLLAESAGRGQFQRDKIDGDQICYVGMSNSKGGLQKRLKQFRTGLTLASADRKGRGGKHSAARHWVDINGVYSFLNDGLTAPKGERFFFNFVAFECDGRTTPESLRTMGLVAHLEYYVLAKLKEMRTDNKVPLWNRPEFAKEGRKKKNDVKSDATESLRTQPTVLI